jgi:peptidoglycan/xylan/chitin deacetylase (PgdA/CDA1 family)
MRSWLRGKSVYVITSWDDATRLDLKLAELLHKYGLKGTFYVITNEIGEKISLDDLKSLSMDNDIGAHTVTHPHLCQVSSQAAKQEILGSKITLEKKLELSHPISFAYPYGEYRSEHVRMVKEAGFCCARTTRPFFIGYPTNLYEMPVSVWTYPHAMKNLKSVFWLAKGLHTISPFLIKNWSVLAMKLFDLVKDQGGVFHLFGHSQQISERNEWERLEAVLNHLGNHRNVIYTTVAGYCNPQRNLSKV